MTIYSYYEYKHNSVEAFMQYDKKGTNGDGDGKVSLGEFKQNGGADFLVTDELKERAYSIFEKYAGEDKKMDEEEYKKYLDSSEYKSLLEDYKVEEGKRAKELKDKNGINGLSQADLNSAKKDETYTKYCENILKRADEAGVKDGKTTIQELIDAEFGYLDNYPSEYKSRLVTSLKKFATKDSNEYVSVQEYINWTNSKEFLTVMNDIKIKDAEKAEEEKSKKSKSSSTSSGSTMGWFNWNPLEGMNWGSGFNFTSLMGNNFTAMLGIQSDWSWIDGMFNGLTGFGNGTGFNLFA